jgi:hypothetical protein
MKLFALVLFALVFASTSCNQTDKKTNNQISTPLIDSMQRPNPNELTDGDGPPPDVDKYKAIMDSIQKANKNNRNDTPRPL